MCAINSVDRSKVSSIKWGLLSLGIHIDDARIYFSVLISTCNCHINGRRIVFSISSRKKYFSPGAPVAHTCNPNYSGGRDQEDHSLKPGS
jgi:hypothetical protein